MTRFTNRRAISDLSELDLERPFVTIIFLWNERLNYVLRTHNLHRIGRWGSKEAEDDNGDVTDQDYPNISSSYMQTRRCQFP